jgi:hypothetical protein
VSAGARPTEPRQHLLPAGDGTLAVPVDRFERLGAVLATRAPDAPAALSTADPALAHIERWLRDNRPEIGAVGTLDAAATSQLARDLQAPLHLVFGRMALDSGDLAVDVLRVAYGRDPRGRPAFNVWRAPFTPQHGRRWAAQRAYLTPDERMVRSRPGRDPFAAFAGDDTDPDFHSIDTVAAQVVLGHAMLLYEAPYALLALVALDPRVTQARSGGLLRRRVTTTVDVRASTRWMIGTPLAAQPWAAPVAYCVVDPPCRSAACTPQPCPAARQAASGVAFDFVSGGPFADTSQSLYRFSTTTRGTTVLAFALASGLVLGGAAPASYAVGSTLLHDGGGLLQPQSGLFGATGNGVLDPPPATDDTARAMRAAAQARALADPLDRARSLDGLSAGFDDLMRADAAALAPATVAQQSRDAVARYRLCRQQGYAGQALRRCAAGRDAAGSAAPGAP